MANLIEPFVEQYIQSDMVVLSVQIVASTLLVLFFAEFLPKTVSRIDPNRILNYCAIPAWIIYWLLWIFVAIVIGLSDFILKKAVYF